MWLLVFLLLLLFLLVRVICSAVVEDGVFGTRGHATGGVVALILPIAAIIIIIIIIINVTPAH